MQVFLMLTGLPEKTIWGHPLATPQMRPPTIDY